MFRNVPIVRFLSLIVIIFLIVGLMGRDSFADVGRFIVSLSLYTTGALLIIWALTQGRRKKPPSKKGDDKQEK